MKKIFVIAVMALISAAAFAQPKFAHVNFTELVQLTPEADQARATIATATKEAQDTYQAMMEEYNTKYATYQQKASTWTATILDSKQKELVDIQTRIQEFEQTVQAELQQQQQNLMAPIYQKAQEQLNAIAKQDGYIYVFDTSSLVYYDATQSVDITPKVRKALGIPDDRTLESLQAELQAQAQQQ